MVEGEEREESWVSRRSISMSPSASAPDSDSDDERSFCWDLGLGSSCAGVDLGRGGGVMMLERSLLIGIRCGGAAVAPEWRRGRLAS